MGVLGRPRWGAGWGPCHPSRRSPADVAIERRRRATGSVRPTGQAGCRTGGTTCSTWGVSRASSAPGCATSSPGATSGPVESPSRRCSR
ncbi:hypothetical protein [Ornithinimicrobium kibberense]|uniref:hypothetical protein n=1 Tax=Ornithinimicrobium kibberense TaxID=282060 RepID=UPI00361692F6